MRSNTVHGADLEIELFYCFDIHCNAFVSFFLIAFIMQVFFMKLMKISIF